MTGLSDEMEFYVDNEPRRLIMEGISLHLTYFKKENIITLDYFRDSLLRISAYRTAWEVINEYLFLSSWFLKMRSVARSKKPRDAPVIIFVRTPPQGQVISTANGIVFVHCAYLWMWDRFSGEACI